MVCGGNDFGGHWQGAVAITPVQLMRAVGAISMGGRMVVPHVVDPEELPKGYVETSHVTETKSIPIDPEGWTFITDAMSRVLLPEGTAPSAHIPGIDIAGKTGSAQIVSLATRAKFKNAADLAQNGWFVGFTPREIRTSLSASCLKEASTENWRRAWRRKCLKRMSTSSGVCLRDGGEDEERWQG